MERLFLFPYFLLVCFCFVCFSASTFCLELELSCEASSHFAPWLWSFFAFWLFGLLPFCLLGFLSWLLVLLASHLSVLASCFSVLACWLLSFVASWLSRFLAPLALWIFAFGFAKPLFSFGSPPSVTAPAPNPSSLSKNYMGSKRGRASHGCLARWP